MESLKLYLKIYTIVSWGLEMNKGQQLFYKGYPI